MERPEKNQVPHSEIQVAEAVARLDTGQMSVGGEGRGKCSRFNKYLYNAM